MASSRPNDNPPRRDGNLSHLPYSSGGSGNVDTPSGGGYGDGMEARVAKLESDVGNIKEGIVEMKQDIRDLRKKADGHFVFLLSAMCAGFLFLLACFGAGFNTLHSDINAMNAKLDASISQANAKADANTAAILAKLK